jgi:integrase
MAANGIDPGTAKKLQAEQERIQAETFKEVTLEWYELKKVNWSEAHATRQLRRLEQYIFPAIGTRQTSTITTLELLALLTAVSESSLEVAHKLKYSIDMIYRHAIITGRTENNPAVSLKGILPPVRNDHFPAPITAKDAAPLLRAIDAYGGSFIVKTALRLAPLLFVRPGNLQQMEWAELDLENALWNIPGPKMKMKQAFLVPLSSQAIQIIKDIQPLSGAGKYVFPSYRTHERCMSNNAINVALRTMGFEKEFIVGHGFRAMARTMLHEVLKFQPDVIEVQLAHAVPDRLGSAYNRCTHIDDRTIMMQTWADYLDKIKVVGKVIEFKQAA